MLTNPYEIAVGLPLVLILCGTCAKSPTGHSLVV